MSSQAKPDCIKAVKEILLLSRLNQIGRRHIMSVHAKVEPIKVTVFGAGSFGTAMATIAARKGHEVVILARDATQVEKINTTHRNPKRLSEFELLPNIQATTDPVKALTDTALIIHAIPVQITPGFLSNIASLIPSTVPILSTSKGIHVETQKLMCDVIPEALARPEQPTAFLSGPSFAKEMMQGFPTSTVVASTDEEVCKKIQLILSTKLFRVYRTNDVIGLEIGGALKNPLAIGAGAIEGVGYGYNALAGMVTRGCSEMRKLSMAMGGKPETLAGLSGIGDLMLTAFGTLSRNRTVGYRLGKGEKLQDILTSMGEVAEGVPTASVVVKLAEKYQLDLPIFRAVHLLLEGNITPSEALDLVMDRPLKGED